MKGGDASIFHNSKYVILQETELRRNCKRKQNDVKKDKTEDFESSAKRVKLLTDESTTDQSSSVTTIPDIHRTGAKCVTGDTPDPKLPGVGYHATGVLRTKPGRGDPTRSMSCSDKIMKWNYVGSQGALLDHYLSVPVYFSTITIGGKEYDMEAVTRALITRLTSLTEPNNEFSVTRPVIKHVDVTCEGLSEDGRILSHKGEK